MIVINIFLETETWVYFINLSRLILKVINFYNVFFNLINQIKIIFNEQPKFINIQFNSINSFNKKIF